MLQTVLVLWVTDYHGLGVLKQKKFVYHSSGSYKCKVRVLQGCILMRVPFWVADGAFSLYPRLAERERGANCLLTLKGTNPTHEDSTLTILSNLSYIPKVPT